MSQKKLKLFWFQIFLIRHRCQRHQWCTLSCEYLREFSKKFETAWIVSVGVLGGNWFMKKTWSRKSRRNVSLNYIAIINPSLLAREWGYISSRWPRQLDWSRSSSCWVVTSGEMQWIVRFYDTTFGNSGLWGTQGLFYQCHCQPQVILTWTDGPFFVIYTAV